MRNPLVSIITPSYNQGRFIRATIESVLSQDYPRIEYIIVDGGSTDETAAIVREYAGRLTFISEKDRGQSHAINKGFQMACGEVVAWLNSDDVILPGAVAHAVRAFERTPTLGAVYGEGYLIDYDGNVKGRFPATIPFNLWRLIYLEDYILQQTVYFRRSIFEEVGLLNEEFHWGLDWDLLIRIGKRYHIEHIPEYMGCLREYDEAKTFSGGHRRFQELAAIMRSHGERRYPPGYFTYGLETYSSIVCRYLPFGLLRRAVRRAAFRLIVHILREAQELYADGCAGGHLRYMFPAGTDRVRIAGLLPNEPRLRGQRLTICCNGSVIERDLSFGEFEFEFDCKSRDAREPVRIDVKASKTVAAGASNRRRLAYLIHRIEPVSRR